MKQPTIDAGEAAAALATVDQARTRSTQFFGYARSGGIVIAWGLVWLTANVATHIDWVTGQYCWAIGIASAILWTWHRSRGGPRNWRMPGLVVLVFVYLLVSEAMIGGVNARLHNAMTSMLVASIYVGLGFWAGIRFVVLGLAVMAAILLGWFVFPAWLYLWLGLGGGGALIITGLWLRRA
ncbi:hypothetical protein [Sphingomonas sp. 28-63-12]|uniref:hypothetical protein n=1 Tax=Sphingomonas sp. 28-63-12 TaxID=1970434 RepID=UPI000BDB631B|nr:MAG: hypothetical protein B7Y47_07305 [Sphingomonas sp. 28-63-12]